MILVTLIPVVERLSQENALIQINQSSYWTLYAKIPVR